MFLREFGDPTAGVFLLILSIVLFLAANVLPPSLTGGLDPNFMPKVLVIITYILSFLQIRAGSRTIRSSQSNEGAGEEKPEYLRVLAVITTFIVHVLVIGPMGFLLSSIAYLFAQVTILAPREKQDIEGITPLAATAVMARAAVYFTFRFGLGVMSPTGILG